MARRGDGLYRRGRTWWLDFRHDGKRHVLRIGKNISRTVAGEIASVKRAGILKGEAGIGKKRRNVSFEKARAEFIAWAETNKKPKTARHYRQHLERLSKTFDGKLLGEIDPLSIERYKRSRIVEKDGKRVGTVAVNRELACLRKLFNFARGLRLYEGKNPLSKIESGEDAVKFLKEPKGRTRYLEPEEEEKLLEVATEPLRTIILVAIYTGLRVFSEILTLLWRDVDFRRGLVTVQAAYAKNGRSRSVPMNAEVREALSRLKEDACAEQVFVSRKGEPFRSIRTAFETACRKAGLTDVTPHVLRHTFASRLAMAGYDLRTIQELGGWEELNMVKRYAHLSPSHKAEAVERIARKNFPTLFTTVGSAVEAK